MKRRDLRNEYYKETSKCWHKKGEPTKNYLKWVENRYLNLLVLDEY